MKTKLAVSLALLTGGLTLGATNMTQAHADTIHTVQSHETLTQIAASNHTTVRQLALRNHLANANHLLVGQQLHITDQGGQTGQRTVKTSNATTSASYTVKSGDTLFKIASQANTSVATLKSLNHLTNDIIYVGQVLSLQKTVSSMAHQATTTAPVKIVTHVQTPVTTASTTSATAGATTVHQTGASTSTASATAGATTVHQTGASTSTASATTTSTGDSAKAWIAQHESGGSYSARNGQYVGKYQLSASYLHGDYSAANQEKVATQYMQARYGSWSAAKAHWQSNGWW